VKERRWSSSTFLLVFGFCYRRGLKAKDRTTVCAWQPLGLLELLYMVSLLAKLFSTADYQTIFENLWLNASSFTCH